MDRYIKEEIIGGALYLLSWLLWCAGATLVFYAVLEELRQSMVMGVVVGTLVRVVSTLIRSRKGDEDEE